MSTKKVGFMPYPSLTQFRTKYVNNYDEVVASEKIHGANVQLEVRTNGGDAPVIRFGKRSGWVGEDEKFFGYQKIVTQYREQLFRATNELVGYDHDSHLVRFFGEIYGGVYNKVCKGPKVQRGVDYSPETELAIFDVVVDGNWLDWDNVIDICKRHALPTPPEIYRGTLTQFLKVFDVEKFSSCVAKNLHGLEDIPPCDAEGVVIRPLKATTEGVWDERLKLKRTSYLEDGMGKINGPSKSRIETTLGVKFLGKMNWNRFNTWRSKVGDESINNMKHMGVNISGLVQDAINDVMLECHGFDATEKKKLEKSLRKPFSQNACRMILKFQMDPDYTV